MEESDPAKSLVPNQDEMERGEVEHSWGNEIRWGCCMDAEIGELMCSQDKWWKLIEVMLYIYYSGQRVGAEQ